MKESTIRTFWMATVMFSTFPFSIDAWAQARLPAQMYFAELSAPVTRMVDAAQLNVIPASTVLPDGELAQLGVWLGSDRRAISRAEVLTAELRRRGAIGQNEEIIGLAGQQALKVRAGTVPLPRTAAIAQRAADTVVLAGE